MERLYNVANEILINFGLEGMIKQFFEKNKDVWHHLNLDNQENQAKVLSKCLGEVVRAFCEKNANVLHDLVDHNQEYKKEIIIKDLEEMIKTFFENEKNQREIIIKCGLKEMVKAFFKDYVIVWHDPNVNNKENQQYIAQLEEFCEVFPFTEWMQAKDYLEKAKASCHVITSGTNGELLVKEISTDHNVENFYIFCADKDFHSHWAKDYQKVSCVETNIQNLLDKIRENLLEWYKKNLH